MGCSQMMGSRLTRGSRYLDQFGCESFGNWDLLVDLGSSFGKDVDCRGSWDYSVDYKGVD